jgi:hypothetical protein
MDSPLHARIARTRPNPVWQTAPTMAEPLHLPLLGTLVALTPPAGRTAPVEAQPWRFRTLLLLALKRRAAA